MVTLWSPSLIARRGRLCRFARVTRLSMYSTDVSIFLAILVYMLIGTALAYATRMPSCAYEKCVQAVQKGKPGERGVIPGICTQWCERSRKGCAPIPPTPDEIPAVFALARCVHLRGVTALRRVSQWWHLRALCAQGPPPGRSQNPCVIDWHVSGAGQRGSTLPRLRASAGLISGYGNVHGHGDTAGLDAPVS